MSSSLSSNLRKLMIKQKAVKAAQLLYYVYLATNSPFISKKALDKLLQDGNQKARAYYAKIFALERYRASSEENADYSKGVKGWPCELLKLALSYEATEPREVKKVLTKALKEVKEQPPANRSYCYVLLLRALKDRQHKKLADIQTLLVAECGNYENRCLLAECERVLGLKCGYVQVWHIMLAGIC